MFKESFKKELENINPDPAFKAELLEKIKSKAEPKSNFTKIKGGRIFLSVTAAALSITVLALSVWWGKGPGAKLTLGKEFDGTAAIQTVSYGDIYKLFKSISDKEKAENRGNAIKDFFLYGTTDDMEWEEESFDSDMAMPGATTGTSDLKGSENTSTNTTVDDAGTGSDDYSSTNVQVDGIDEGDIVKTDGKYIYVSRQNDKKIFIIKAENGKMELVSSIDYGKIAAEQGEKEYFTDMYVKNGRLVLITSLYNSYAREGYGATTHIVTRIFDIVTPPNITLIKTLTQSGNYVSSRLSENVLYVFTTHSFYGEPNADDTTTFIPTTGENGEQCTISEDNICAFSGDIKRTYFIATSADILTAERIDTKTVLGAGNEVYVNNQSIYAAACFGNYEKVDGEKSDFTYNRYSTKTRLIRFEIADGKLSYGASGEVAGQILNQFSMDEYEGHFRIVTTVESSVYATKWNGEYASTYSMDRGGQSNALYVLDKDLKVVGSIEDVAPDEKVYSVRFAGAVGYFVTFRQVDPLFTVDLSDPKNPTILSALKIPGFSSYLHPYGDGLLLGVGRNADEKTGKVGTAKLSMFNVSDPKNVTEQSLCDLGVNYIPAEYEHKAVFVNLDKNLIGLAGSDYADPKYFIYTYKDNAFVKVAELPLDGYSYDLNNVRGLYIGNYFYLCEEDTVYSFTLDGFETVATVRF